MEDGVPKLPDCLIALREARVAADLEYTQKCFEDRFKSGRPLERYAWHAQRAATSARFPDFKGLSPAEVAEYTKSKRVRRDA